jgi:hypothetical protein
MNLLSALGTAVAGALTAWLIARERDGSDTAVGAVVGAVLAGVMCSVWANATETEVYAVSLLHVMLMLACAARSTEAPEAHGDRWLALTAYVIALTPAVHLSALVGAPAAIVLASRRRDGAWRVDRLLLLGGVFVATAGVGRMSVLLVAGGLAISAASALLPREMPDAGRARRALLAGAAMLALASSALLILLLRARHDPMVNQGNPATLSALADLVARRQYEVAGLLPRQAPVWLQLANVAQYVDWQFALGWGHGIFTTPARVIATLAYLALGILGMRAMRRELPRLALVFGVLLFSGTLGVATYLNLKAGASLGYGLIPDSAPHEARERDYFFVLGFWAWGCLAGYGALAVTRLRRVPTWLAAGAVLVPLVANWKASDRSRPPASDSAETVALALLESAPRDALLFVAGDNDSYPLWYVQQVEEVRPDVQLVTLPLLPARWYQAEIARRTGWRWPAPVASPGIRWQHEAVAAAIAAAARKAGRPVVASPSLTARERALLGSGWTLRGPLYVSAWPAGAGGPAVRFDSVFAVRWATGRPVYSRPRGTAVDDVAATMLTLLDCSRLALPRAGPAPGRDSLEVKCNLR